MALPTIPNPTPVIIPAVAEITYESAYIVCFSMGTSDAAGNIQPLSVTFRPYAYATQQLYPDNTKDFARDYPNAWVLAAAHPLAAQAIGGLVQVFALELQLGEAEKAVAAAQEPLDTANARLVEIAELLLTESDEAIIAALTAEDTAIDESLAGLSATLADATTARDAILAALGVT